MVFGYILVNCGGAGFLPGAGLYRLSLPLATVPTEFSQFNNTMPIGKAYLHDADSVALSTVMVTMYDVANNCIVFRKHDGNFWRENTPITLAQNDRLSVMFNYPTAVA